MPSVKKNFSYNLVLTLCGYIFPLITYPYVSRVLGVHNIGVCNFVDSIINYFVLFSMLGVGSYGVREIARVREDIAQRNYVFSNLFTFNLLTTILAVGVLIICTFTVPKFADYKDFLLVGVAKLIFNIFLIEWLYQGIQDFKYITIRSLIVRIVYVVLVFVLVHTTEDVLVYFSLTVVTTVINAGINWVHSMRFVKYSIKGLDLKMFIVPIVTFGYYRILTSMYTTFNTVFLGFSSGDVEVGYFATATKLYSIIMSVLTAFTTVMVPRVAELLHNGEIKQLQRIANQTLSIISCMSIPIILYCLFCASDVILLIAGRGYEGAITPFRIVIFLLLIIGTEQILIQQFLMASQKNSPILIVSTIGAVVGVSLNIVLTPNLGAIGSAISWGVSELCVLLSGMFLVKKNIGVSVSMSGFIKDFLWSFLYVAPLYIISKQNLGMWSNLIVSGISIILVFIIINLFLRKNETVIGLLNDARGIVGGKRRHL